METTTTTDQANYRILVLGDGSVRTLSLVGKRWTIGRSPDCEVPLRDPTVSRRHALLERRGDEFTIQDLGGANPVLVDGKPTRSGPLAIGQTVSIGLTRLILECKAQPAPLATVAHPTVVLSREVADEDDATGDGTTFASTAARVLDRLEWALADLGDLSHAAEPLLELALSLTGRRVGWIGRLADNDAPEPLASLDTTAHRRRLQVPANVLADARRIQRPHLVTCQEQGAATLRLMIPLGPNGECMLVLEDAADDAPTGQELLRLARSLAQVVWQRLQETTERLRLRDELQRLRLHGTAAHHALLASARLQEARLALRSMSGSCSRLLLVGEEGTELEDLARFLHAESPRQAAPFVSWNAGRVPAWRHDGELFGDRGQDGALRRAQGGTLFVDQFDKLALATQNQLLARVHTEGAAGTAPVLVVASHVALDRLPPAPLAPWQPHECLSIPPLRQHARDIIALAELFLSELGAGPSGTPRLLGERTKRHLVDYAWPGNVRELRLVLEDAAARAGDQPIAPRHLPPHVAVDAGVTNDIATLEEVERLHIIDVLQRVGGNRTRAAQVLGIATSTLYEKLKRYRIDA